MRLMSKFSLLRPQLILVTLVGSIVMAVVCVFGDTTMQVAFLGSYVSILGGLALEIYENQNAKKLEQRLVGPSIRLAQQLAQDSRMFHEYEKIIDGISASLNIRDPLFREFALDELEQLGKQSEELGRGVITFHETETWRVAYEKILRSPSVTHYFSCALISSLDYWQDEPGRRSTELNFELQVNERLNIERIAILSEDVWPEGELKPLEPIFSWLWKAYDYGTWTELVRQSSIVDEPDLLLDFGCYSSVAVGKQILDKKSRTSKFILSFNQDDIDEGKKRWERLTLFSISLREILDQMDRSS